MGTAYRVPHGRIIGRYPAPVENCSGTRRRFPSASLRISRGPGQIVRRVQPHSPQRLSGGAASITWIQAPKLLRGTIVLGDNLLPSRRLEARGLQHKRVSRQRERRQPTRTLSAGEWSSIADSRAAWSYSARAVQAVFRANGVRCISRLIALSPAGSERFPYEQGKAGLLRMGLPQMGGCCTRAFSARTDRSGFRFGRGSVRRVEVCRPGPSPVPHGSPSGLPIHRARDGRGTAMAGGCRFGGGLQ